METAQLFQIGKQFAWPLPPNADLSHIRRTFVSVGVKTQNVNGQGLAVFGPTATEDKLDRLFKRLGYSGVEVKRDEDVDDDLDDLSDELDEMMIDDAGDVTLQTVKAFKGVKVNQRTGRCHVDVLFSDGSREWVPDTDERLPLCPQLFEAFKDTPTVYIVARVSTAEQGKGVSNDVQVAEMLAFHRRGGYLREDIDTPRIRVVQCVGSAYRQAHDAMRMIAEHARPGDVVMVLRCDRFGRDGFDAMAMANQLVSRGCHFVACDMKKELITQSMSSEEHPVNADAYMASFAEGLKYSADLARKSNLARAWCRDVRGDNVRREYGWKTAREDVTIRNKEGQMVRLTGDKGRLVSVPNPKECFLLGYLTRYDAVNVFHRLDKGDKIYKNPETGLMETIKPRRGDRWTKGMVSRLSKLANEIERDDPRCTFMTPESSGAKKVH